MATYDYGDYVLDLHQKSYVNRKYIFDFFRSRLEVHYSQYYQFCQENLSETNSENISQPARVYFANDDEFKAGAIKRGEYSIIRINKGLIEFMHNIILHRFGPKVLDEPSEEVLEYGTNPINTIMFQVSLLFIFYHELAHLIQFRGTDEVEKEESYSLSGDGTFNIEDHIMETDADIYASNYICDHIIDFIKTNPTQKFADDVIVFSMTGILILFLKLHGNNTTLYYDKTTHPHPSIRLSIVIHFMVTTLKSKLKTIPNGNQIEINEQQIINEINSICESRLFGYFMDGPLPSEYLKIIRENKTQIQDYANFLLAKRLTHPKSTQNLL